MRAQPATSLAPYAPVGMGVLARSKQVRSINALAESQIGLYKSELIHHEGPWRDVDQVEAATASWVLWFNSDRPHGSIDDLTPLEVEQLDYARIEPVEQAG